MIILNLQINQTQKAHRTNVVHEQTAMLTTNQKNQLSM